MIRISNNDCDRDHCPFRSDPYNPNRQVCVKCGQDYFFRRNSFSFSNFFVIAGLVVFLLLVIKVVSNHRQTINSQHQMQNTTQSRK